MSKPIVIMGAGPAGLTAAWELTREGKEVVVWEADPAYVGGLSRTVQAEGFRFDIGGHRFFSKSQEVNEVWRQILPDDFIDCPRMSRIFYNKKYFNYPLEAVNAFRNLGPVETLRIILSYFEAKVRPIKPETTFAQWVTNRFGERLFLMFFKAYTEKVWGISCDEISADWAAQRIKGLSLREAVLSAFIGRKANPTAKTLIRNFFYPRFGPGQMWETAAEKIIAAGNKVLLDRKVQTIHWDETGVTHVTGINQLGEFFQQEGYHFISSIPLKELMLSLDPPPPKEVVAAAKRLRYRDFITVCLVVNKAKVFPDTWLYIHDPSVKVGRIQNYKNWSTAMVPDQNLTSLGMEYFCFENDGVWSSTDYDLAQLAIREAAQIGLIKDGEVQDAFVVRMPKAYPIYDRSYQENLKVIREWVSLFANLQPVGRNGMHKYNNQDHSMMTAMLAARNVTGDRHFDCWKVNTDAEYIEKDAPQKLSQVYGMPHRRPRPVQLNAAPRRRTRPTPKSPRRPRAPRKGPGSPAVLYWIAGALAVTLAIIVALYLEAPDIKAWLAGEHPAAETAPSAPAPENAPAEKPVPAPKPVPPPPPQLTEEQRLEQLRKKANEQTEKLVQQQVPKPTPAPHAATNLAPSLPPVAQPITATGPSGAPARALPLDPNKLDTERIAAYQVALERIHFSCGFIDGDQGMRTQRMLRAYQASRGLSVTGFLDEETRNAIGEPGEPFLNYTVTADDIASIMPRPVTWREKAKATRLGYNDMWEMLAEKFHCTRAYLRALNPDVKTFAAGTEVIGPKVFPAETIPKAASLRIILSETSIEALDAGGKVIAFFPCSIAKDKNKRPNGVLTVISVVPNPDYTFDPALFADAAKAEGITKKMVLQPGPRNPVGTAWIGLSLPGYGIHGTPAPESISSTQSHGCFRLANWNAEKVLKMVKIGTPVDVQP